MDHKRHKKSVQVMDRLCKNMIRTKEQRTYIQLRQITENSSKKWNKILHLIKISRELHHQKYFEENRNLKAILQGIHNIYSKTSTKTSLLTEENTVTDSQDTSEHFINMSKSTKQYQKSIFQIIWRFILHFTHNI